MNMRLRPMKSAMRPPMSSRPPNARVYAVSAHCRLAMEMCRARCAEGSAMVTTDASSTIINWAMAIMARARKRLGSSSSGGAVRRSTGRRVVVVAVIRGRLPAFFVGR